MACEMFSNRNANGLRVCTLTGLEQNLADEMQGAPDGVNVAVGRPLQFKLFLARHNIKGSFKEVTVKLRALVLGKQRHRLPNIPDFHGPTATNGKRKSWCPTFATLATQLKHWGNTNLTQLTD